MTQMIHLLVSVLINTGQSLHKRTSAKCCGKYLNRSRISVAFVSCKFLSDTAPAPEATTPPSTEIPPAPEGSATYALVVTEKGSLNLRRSPSAAAALLNYIPRNAYVQVLEKGSEWCKVTYNNQTGYAMTKFLVFSELVAD